MPNEKKTGDLTLLQKLLEISKSIDFLKKEADGYKFKYVAGVKVLSIIKGKMDELGVLLIPRIVEKIYHPNGTIDLTMEMMWQNIDNIEDFFAVQWFAIGNQKDPSQAFGSALTYSERYFFLKFFHIPTDEDDPDGRIPEDNKSKEKIPVSELDKLKAEVIKMANFLAKDTENPQVMAENFIKEASNFIQDGKTICPPLDKIKKVEWLKKNTHGKLKKQIEDLGFKVEDALNA